MINISTFFFYTACITVFSNILCYVFIYHCDFYVQCRRAFRVKKKKKQYELHSMCKQRLDARMSDVRQCFVSHQNRKCVLFLQEMCIISANLAEEGTAYSVLLIIISMIVIFSKHFYKHICIWMYNPNINIFEFTKFR
jgi:hypothetical protein